MPSMKFAGAAKTPYAKAAATKAPKSTRSIGSSSRNTSRGGRK